MWWLLLAGLAVAAAAAAVGVAVRMPGRSHRGALAPLTEGERTLREELRRHVQVLASDIGERHIWNAGSLDAAAGYILRHFSGAGLSVTEERFAVRGAEVANVIAEVEPSVPETETETVVVGAHYDSVVGTVGANDNASGVAALLELARLQAERPRRRRIRFVAFVNEEPPFFLTSEMGSRRHARRCRERGERVSAMLALETLGCYSDRRFSQSYPFPFGLFYPRTGNFVAFVGNLRSRALVRRCIGTFRRRAAFPSEGTAAPGYLPGVFWSDHWSFWREGYPALMVTDTALFRYGYYHLAGDTPEKLDYGRLARVVAGLARVVEELAECKGRSGESGNRFRLPSPDPDP